MKTIQKISKRTYHFITIETKNSKVKKVGTVLKKLGLDIVGTGKNHVSLEHDNILYK